MRSFLWIVNFIWQTYFLSPDRGKSMPFSLQQRQEDDCGSASQSWNGKGPLEFARAAEFSQPWNYYCVHPHKHTHTQSFSALPLWSLVASFSQVQKTHSFFWKFLASWTPFSHSLSFSIFGFLVSTWWNFRLFNHDLLTSSGYNSVLFSLKLDCYWELLKLSHWVFC